MNHPDPLPPRWSKVSAALRAAGLGRRPAGEDLSAPHGFATRLVARALAEQRAESAGLVLWRRWSLVGATSALLLFGGSFLLKPDPRPSTQLIPIPALDELPTLSPR